MDATRKLGMLKRNFWNCDVETKDKLYSSIVRSKLEYACSIWDPHLVGEQRMLEKVQKRALKFIYNCDFTDYCLFLHSNGILSLHQRRSFYRLCMLYRMIHGLLDLNFNQYFTWSNKDNLRTCNSMQLRYIFARTNVYKYSFIPRTIDEWNNLPKIVVSCNTLQAFKSQLVKHMLSSHFDCKDCTNL